MQPDENILPWSFEAESSVISTLLNVPERFDTVGAILKPEMFHDLGNRAIYKAISVLVMACKPVDLVTVYEAMKQAGTVGDVAMNVRRYAEIVAERALMRGLISAADQSREVAITPGLSGSERLDKCQNLFQQLAVARTTREPKSAGEFVVSFLDRLQDLADGKIQAGIRTRIPTLDTMLGGGFKSGKQIVLAARPSVGKSALAMEFAYAFAEQGIPSAILSMEMESAELVNRLTARIGSIELEHLSTGRLTESEWTAVADAVSRIGGLPLYIDDQPGLTLGDIQAKARKLSREHGIRLLVVDYLQLCSPSDSKANRHHQIEELSRGLKVLAKQLGITTVVLSQLNREVEKRTSGRPTLADLKESGAIEEDADTVILLSADGIRENGDVVVNAEIAKNRGGRKGAVKLAFSGRYQRFVETVATDFQFKQPARPARQYSEEF
jgi:replicative DNA helicase